MQSLLKAMDEFIGYVYASDSNSNNILKVTVIYPQLRVYCVSHTVPGGGGFTQSLQAATTEFRPTGRINLFIGLMLHV